MLRDYSGGMLFAFSTYVGENSSLRAEVLAISIGLQLCSLKGFGQFCVQSDSLVLVGILQRRLVCPWHILREVKQIWQMGSGAFTICHCFREANKVVDILSNEGVSHP